MPLCRSPNNSSKRPAAHALHVVSAIIFIAFGAPALAQTAPASKPEPEPSVPYTLKPSDKLIVMSRQMFSSPNDWKEVARFNNLKNPDSLRAGQVIRIPLRFMQSRPAGAKIVSASGDVQLAGSPAGVGTLLAEGGRLQTGANSSAVVELADGSRMTLLPNTLAELATSRNYATRDVGKSASSTWFSGLVRLAQGGLETLAAKAARRATPLQIETATSTVGVRGTEFRVAFDDPAGGSARTEVIEGKVRADNTAQQSGADVPTGKGAVIKPAEKDIKVVNLLPAPNLAGIPAEVIKPPGNWPMPVPAGAVAYRVQVASDEKFEKIVRDLKVEGTGGSASLATLANGSWFARVRGIDPAGLEGFDAVKRISLKNAIWRVSYSSMSLVNGQAVLVWTGQLSDGLPLTGSGFSALLGTDAALTQGVVTAEGNNQQLALGELKPGVYFIRLGSKLPQGGSFDSGVYRLVIPETWGQSQFLLNSPLEALN